MTSAPALRSGTAGPATARRRPGPAPGSCPVPRDSPLAAALARLPAGLAVRRTWPSGDDLVVEALVAESSATRRGPVAAVVTPDAVRVHAGEDPRLPALAAELARPGATLLGHRAGRRAVLRVRATDGVHYVKVVRPGRAGRVADGLRAAERRLGAAGRVAVPAVLTVDDAAGVVRLAEVPGPTLHELLVARAPRAVVTAGRMGDALSALAAAPGDATEAGPAVHDAAAEAAVLLDWAREAARWGGPDLREPALAVAAALRALPARPPVLAHRDLHDKQVVAAGQGIGLLDLDTLCRADPALDRGNLHAHLHLRVLQGRCPPTLAGACAARLGADDRRAVGVYTAAALLRLAAVYTFRPGPRGLPERLLATAFDVLAGATPWPLP